jgi:hypothetical protein
MPPPVPATREIPPPGLPPLGGGERRFLCWEEWPFVPPAEESLGFMSVLSARMIIPSPSGGGLGRGKLSLCFVLIGSILQHIKNRLQHFL